MGDGVAVKSSVCERESERERVCKRERDRKRDRERESVRHRWLDLIVEDGVAVRESERECKGERT